MSDIMFDCIHPPIPTLFAPHHPREPDRVLEEAVRRFGRHAPASAEAEAALRGHLQRRRRNQQVRRECRPRSAAA